MHFLLALQQQFFFFWSLVDAMSAGNITSALPFFSFFFFFNLLVFLCKLFWSLVDAMSAGNITSALTFFSSWSDPSFNSSYSSSQSVFPVDSGTVALLSLFLASSIVVILFGKTSKKKEMKNSLPPGPSPWPIVGSFPAMLMAKMPRYKWVYKVMQDLNTDIACVRLGKTHVISVSCPEISVEFLKKFDSIFSSRPLTVATGHFSNGFLTVVTAPLGDQWRKMRRVLTSEILSPARIKWMLEKRNVEADNIVFYIFSQIKANSAIDGTRPSSGSVINVRTVAQHFTGSVTRRMLFNTRYYNHGREDGGPTPDEERHTEALFRVLFHLHVFSISDYFPWLKRFDLDGYGRVVKEAVDVIRKYDEPIIDERVQQWREGKRKKPDDFLDILISLQDDNGRPLLSLEEIKGQITELLVAAIDNPSNMVEWALAEMLNQPETLQKATEEIDRVVGKERLVQESDIPQLHYLTSCAREAFRLHPVAPFNVPHQSTADAVVSGYFIPKGSQVLLSRIGLGRNPKTWTNPEKFDPERHMNEGSFEKGIAEPDLRFITFARGRRGCVGGVLGTKMAMMLFDRLLQGFSWSKPAGVERIDLTPADCMFLAQPLHACAEKRLPDHLYPRVLMVPRRCNCKT